MVAPLTNFCGTLEICEHGFELARQVLRASYEIKGAYGKVNHGGSIQLGTGRNGGMSGLVCRRSGEFRYACRETNEAPPKGGG